MKANGSLFPGRFIFDNSYAKSLRLMLIAAIASHYMILSNYFIFSIILDYLNIMPYPLFSIFPFIGLILLWPNRFSVCILLLIHTLLGLLFLIPGISSFNDRHGAGLLFMGYAILFLANALLLLFILFKISKRLRAPIQMKEAM
jgi:hypothetical protein